MNGVGFEFQPSVLYRSKIVNLFRTLVDGRYGCVDHFAVNIIRPNGQAFSLCPDTDYLVHYQCSDVSKYEIALKPWVVSNSVFIPWRTLLSPTDLNRWNKLVSFKEQRCGLFSGISFVIKRGEYYLNVAVASKTKKEQTLKVFVSRAEEILNLGSYFYEYLVNDLEAMYECDLPRFMEIELNEQQLSNVDVFQRLKLSLSIPFLGWTSQSQSCVGS